jgi:hypothetical protein
VVGDGLHDPLTAHGPTTREVVIIPRSHGWSETVYMIPLQRMALQLEKRLFTLLLLKSSTAIVECLDQVCVALIRDELHHLRNLLISVLTAAHVCVCSLRPLPLFFSTEAASLGNGRVLSRELEPCPLSHVHICMPAAFRRACAGAAPVSAAGTFLTFRFDPRSFRFTVSLREISQTYV